MPQSGYTPEPVLCGLQQAVKASLFTDAPFEANTRLHDYIAEHGIDAFDYVFLRSGIEECFGISLPESEWFALLEQGEDDREKWAERVAPKLTFG